MNTSSSTKTRDRLMKGLILKFAVIQFAVTIISCVAYRFHFTEILQDETLGVALLCSAIWSVLGITFFPYLSASKRIAYDVQKVLIFVLFFAPTLSIMTFGPMLSDKGFANLPKVSEFFSDVPLVKTTKQMFFARFPIARGEALTAKNTIVLAVDPSEYIGGIIATKSNHFGDAKNKDSMLLRKCIYPIEAGSPIRDSDIEPHYQ